MSKNDTQDSQASAPAPLKTFQIWAEGLESTGDGEKKKPVDVHLAHVESTDFESACAQLAKSDANFAKQFDADAMTYCGCKLVQKPRNTAG